MALSQPVAKLAQGKLWCWQTPFTSNPYLVIGHYRVGERDRRAFVLSLGAGKVTLCWVTLEFRQGQPSLSFPLLVPDRRFGHVLVLSLVPFGDFCLIFYLCTFRHIGPPIYQVVWGHINNGIWEMGMGEVVCFQLITFVFCLLVE